MSTVTKKTPVATTMPTLRELVDAGAHFGHRRSRSHPNARQFVYAIRDRVLVINLEDTVAKLKEAAAAAEAWAAEGKVFLFVGTKPQAAEVVRATAIKAGMPYITQRWLGGTLTNYPTIRRNLDKLARLDEVAASPQFEAFTKQQRVGLSRTRDKLQKMFGGIAGITKIPDVLVIVDLDQEKIAVREANTLGLPIIGLVDTNVDPNLVTYPIPANDDSRRTIELVLHHLTEAIIAGVARIPAPVAAESVATNDSKEPVVKSENYADATTAEQMARDLGGSVDSSQEIVVSSADRAAQDAGPKKSRKSSASSKPKKTTKTKSK